MMQEASSGLPHQQAWCCMQLAEDEHVGEQEHLPDIRALQVERCIHDSLGHRSGEWYWRVLHAPHAVYSTASQPIEKEHILLVHGVQRLLACSQETKT